MDFIPQMDYGGIKNPKHNRLGLNPNAKIFTPQLGYREAIISNIDIPNTGLAKTTVYGQEHIDVNLLSPNIEVSGTYDLSNLNDLRVKYLHKIIICHLNINSIRNKIDVLANFVMGKVDILFISESKIDCSFPTGQFTIPGFSPPYRKDRSDRGGGVLLYLRQDIPSKLLNHTWPL